MRVHPSETMCKLCPTRKSGKIKATARHYAFCIKCGEKTQQGNIGSGSIGWPLISFPMIQVEDWQNNQTSGCRSQRRDRLGDLVGFPRNPMHDYERAFRGLVIGAQNDCIWNASGNTSSQRDFYTHQLDLSCASALFAAARAAFARARLV